MFLNSKQIHVTKIVIIRQVQCENTEETSDMEIGKENKFMSECIFCKIAGGEIPSATLYEDEEFRVILDLGPANKGHALILPKKHYADLYELPDETAGRAMILAKKVMKKMKDVLNCDGYNLVQNNGPAAGQTVFHFHIHLIPRTKGDNAGISWTPGVLTEEDKKEIMEKFSLD